MVNIQIISDLHLEAPAAYDIYDITPTSPYLALIGDIGCTQHDGLFHFLLRQLSQFDIVFFLLGNHEPYHSSLSASKDRLVKFQEETEKVDGSPQQGRLILLDQTRYDLTPNVTILGCTLFSHIGEAHRDAVGYGLNDFNHIADWTVDAHNAHHSSDLAWLNDQVLRLAAEEPERKAIVLTHYSPTIDARSVDPRHAGSSISSGFMTDLGRETCCTTGNMGVWAFGHTHYNCDFVQEGNGIRFVANQRGYYFSQADGFEVQKVVEL